VAAANVVIALVSEFLPMRQWQLIAMWAIQRRSKRLCSAGMQLAPVPSVQQSS
jgi:hypothetical protein